MGSVAQAIGQTMVRHPDKLTGMSST